MTSGPYAVMVYAYGGGFHSGANFPYPGYYLASKDVVVVVPNYRINTMGKMRKHYQTFAF